MSWRRFADETPWHPKVLRLAREDRWTWFELVCYCGRYKTEGTIPEAVSEALPHADDELLFRLRDVGLLDLNLVDGVYSIHDWPDYNPPKDPTARDRKRRQRARERDTERDEAVTASGPEAASAAASHNSGRDTTVTEPSRPGPSRARGRARPVPSSGPSTVSEGRERDAGSPPSTPQQAASTASTTPYEVALGWVRNAGWSDPHLARTLREDRPELTEAEVQALVAEAREVAGRGLL
jgi:hypothetical protein